VGENARERRSQARHFCNLAFPGLKERFPRGIARSRAGNIVLYLHLFTWEHGNVSWERKFFSELVSLNFVKITA